MKQHFLLLLLLLLLSPQLAHAQGGWTGDLDEFIIEDGIAKHQNNGKSGSAVIYKDFTSEASGSFTWSLGFVFQDLPTSSNTFEVTLFNQEVGNFRYYYKVVPTKNNTSIGLIKETYQKISSTESRKLSSTVLTSWQNNSGYQLWQKVQVEVDYHATKGIRFRWFTPVSGLRQGEWIELPEGRPYWRMSLRTKFTSKKKLNNAYILPKIIQDNTGGEEEKLHIQEQWAEQSGRVHLKLSGPVSIRDATVTCAGFQPTIYSGDKAEDIVINLGATFMPGNSYHFDIKKLIDRNGKYADLSFQIDIESIQPGTTIIPEGIFITEVMASPPDDGPLQGTKYIELYNNTGAQKNLALYTLYYGKSKYPLPNIVLAHGAFAILYLESNPYPTRVATLVPMPEFPALSGSFKLRLVGSDNKTHDEVNFNSQIYGEGVPKGKASIERVGYQPDLWRRSTNPNGGTPGMPTTLQPYRNVAPKSIVINELLLSPPTTGEKYIELFNTSTKAVNLADLYLTYRNKEESITSTSWLIVPNDYLLQPNSYVVLTPYPDALPRLYPEHDSHTFVERIDFPSISTTYSEVALRAHSNGEVIDQVVYRRQWLGDTSNDRTGFSLERLSPSADGTKKESWQRAQANGNNKNTGGTPGRPNSANGIPLPDRGNYYIEWPEDPILTYEQVEPLLQVYAPLATLTLYSINGDLLMTSQGEEITNTLQSIRIGNLPFPSMLMVLVLQFQHPEKEPSNLFYRSVWLHI